jgi:RHS repeat-associated protein
MCDLSGDGTLFYCHDGNKNVSEAVTPDATIAAHYEYSSFGKVVLVTSENEEESIAYLNPYSFSSEYTDDALGLVYYNYRHYNPKDGRWIGRDLIEETGGMNLYAFVGNAAVGGFDHSGRISIGGIVAGVAAAALASRIIYCYYAVIDSAGDYGNSDGYAHCVVACNFNNCMGGALGKLGRIGSSAITLLGAVLWEVVSGWEKDAENDIRSGYNGVKGSIVGKPCPDACKCEGNNMPSLR